MNQLKTAIAGSFKFKPEIDRLHEEFADYGVSVLEPTKGWLFVPSQHGIVQSSEFRPLPAERHLQDIRDVEARFLAAIEKSDFLYLFNPNQYVGLSAAFEVGYALGASMSIYAKEPIALPNADYDLDTFEFLKSAIQIATPEQAARITREQQEL